MNSALAKLLIEEMLRGAIEVSMQLRKMDAEGRTELTPEEVQKVRQATDTAAMEARAKASLL